MLKRELDSLGVPVELQCTLPALAPLFEALTATYARPGSGVPPTLRYTVGPGNADAATRPYGVWRNERLVYESADTDELAPAFELDLYRELTRRITDAWLLHAATLVTDSGALVLFGPSGSGKSTLAHALVGRGAGYVSDEWSVLDATASVRGVTRPIVLDGRVVPIAPCRATDYPMRDRDGRIVHATLVQPPAAQLPHRPAEVAALVAIEHVPDGGSRSQRLSSHQAIERLWRCTLNPSSAVMQVALEVLAHVPVWTITSSTVEDALTALAALGR